MIKINLLPTRAAKKKKAAATGGGQIFLAILILLLAGEGVGLWLWLDGEQQKVISANQTATELQKKVQSLQRVKQQIAEDEKQQALLEEQNQILERLKDGKSGPPNMLMFIDYALTDPPDSLANEDELKALQKAGWNLQWDSDSVWLSKLDEDEWGTVTLEGEARSHEDVAEFYQRLRSSIYFENLEPGPQERKYDQGIEMKYIAFKGQADLNYRMPTPEGEAAEGDTPVEEGGAVAPGTGEKKDDMIVPGQSSAEGVPGPGDL